jgi:hypothetical protein
MSVPTISAPTTNSLTIGFAAPTDLGVPASINHYEGSTNGGAAITNIGNPPSFVWTGLTAKTAYSIVVRACNGAAATTCGPWSPAGSGTTTEAPRAPGQMTPPVIQDASPSALRIGFAQPTDLGNPASILRYEGMINGGATADITLTGTFVWGALAPGTGYSFQVRACNATGCGAWSGSTSGTTQAPTPTIAFTFNENPFSCNGVSRGFGSVTGFQPGEIVRFTWNNNGKNTLLPGTANGSGTVNLLWQCTNADWEGAIALTAVGQSSGRSGTGNFTEAKV